MSWAGDRLTYLKQRYSYAEIRETTGIPESTISYVVRGERKLGAQYILNLKSMYSRSVYAELRAAGASTYVARMYRYRSVASAEEFLSESNKVIRDLAQYRLAQYSEYLKSKGLYESESVTLQILYDAIRKSMARSPIDLGKHQGGDSPSLRHFVVEPEEE